MRRARSPNGRARSRNRHRTRRRFRSRRRRNNSPRRLLPRRTSTSTRPRPPQRVGQNPRMNVRETRPRASCPAPPAGHAIDGTKGRVVKSPSDLVVLHGIVFDRRFNAVADLAQEQFAVFEHGRQQQITFFKSEDVRVAAGLVVDNSSSVIARYGLVVTGAMAFADSSHPEDELFTVHFNEHIRPGLPPQIRFTSNRVLLRAAFAAMKPGGKTALYDAVIDALDRVEQATHQKHVIVVLTDGEDNASVHTKKEMYERAGGSNVIN